jgi:hypothetical protein
MYVKNACYQAATLVLTMFVLAGVVREANAWGPHPQITRAAIKVLPDLPRWKAALGTENLAALADYCWMPDERGMDMGAYYADDYLLIHQMPRHISHVMPDVKQTFIPYFRRALQALRTETPLNACRQIGSLIHFVEDTGAPPHAREQCPHHSELENWVRGEQVIIKDYRPQLLGKTDAEAEAGFLRRMAGLVVFSKARADRALPLVSEPKPDRAKVEPIILESALESARVTADVLYTLFTLGLASQTEGASLMGTVTAATLPLRDNHGARIVLVGTDYATLATTADPRPNASQWSGNYELRNLPPGDYRVLAYRTGSQVQISKPVHLESGGQTRLDMQLKGTNPAGNIIENPDGRLESLQPGVADRWTVIPGGPQPLWSSTGAYAAPNTTYRCGAILKDPAAKVQFVFRGRPSPQNKHPQPLICPLSFDGKLRGELTITPDAPRWDIAVQVRTTRPLKEAIERVWVVPEVDQH